VLLHLGFVEKSDDSDGEFRADSRVSTYLLSAGPPKVFRRSVSGRWFSSLGGSAETRRTAWLASSKLNVSAGLVACVALVPRAEGKLKTQESEKQGDAQRERATGVRGTRFVLIISNP